MNRSKRQQMLENLAELFNSGLSNKEIAERFAQEYTAEDYVDGIRDLMDRPE